MFDFLSMMFDYGDRKIDRYEDGEIFVDTCSVTDAEHPYETAVSHPKYNDGKLVIVEEYDTADDAQAGHDKWVSIITSKNLPGTLIDVSTARVAQLSDIFDDDWRDIEENIFIDSWNEDNDL